MPKAIKKESPTPKPIAKKKLPAETALAPSTPKVAAKKQAPVQAIAPAASSSHAVPQHHVAESAYYLWMERGRPYGNALADWLRAEQQLHIRKAA